MSDDTNINWRTRWAAAYAWCLAHPTAAACIAGAVTGFALGAILL